MTKRKSSNQANDGPEAVTGKRRSVKSNLAKLFLEENRGLLLDIFVFVTNVFLMRLVTRVFIDLFNQLDVKDQEPIAKFLLGLAFLAMWILPALGAVLKRWHFHQRLKLQGKTVAATKLTGCLFNPLFYFCLNLVITSAILTSLGDFLFGRVLLNNGAIFVPIIIGGFVLTIVQTFLIYQYFSAPKSPPKAKFLRDPQSEALGDICIFINMILFQVFWNLLAYADLGRPSSILEFCARLFVLCFLALLIYFPPRMFYLAEDIAQGRTWLTMLIANSPVIVRVLVGTSSNPTSW